MCYHLMRINASSSSGARFGFVPCGKCEECRNVNKSAWAFRLCAEIEAVRSENWKVGFCTLTYDPEHLPIIDKKFFKPGSRTYLSDIPCFNKNHIRDYIHALRNWFFKEFQVKSVKYMVVTEYGSKTARPHYHLLMAWNPNGFRRKVDSSGRFIKDGRRFVRERCQVTADIVHAWLKDNWKYGFLLPENCLGGMRRGCDGKLRKLQPFEVENAGLMAARYAAKYVCKDLSFPDILNSEDFVQDMDDDMAKELRDCSPFHMQCQSLGLSLIKNATPQQLIQLVESGHCFPCEEEFKQLPVYLKNKIFFSPKYCLFEEIDEETGEVVIRRLVRRERTKFFNDYYREIYQKRSTMYSDLINQCLREDFWIERNCTSQCASEFVDSIRSRISDCGFSPLLLAQYYLSYYGVDQSRCYDIDLATQWFTRYTTVYNDCAEEIGNDIDCSRFSLIDYELRDKIHLFWSGLFHCLSSTNGYLSHDYDVDEVYEFWNPKNEVIYAAS